MATLDDLIVEQVRRHRAKQESAPSAEAEDMFAGTPEAEPVREREPAAREAEAHPDAEPAELAALEESVKAAAPPPPPPPPIPKDRFLADIESAMQEDLEELYRQLPPGKRQMFRSRGEQTATAVRQLAAQAHANVHKIFVLLFEWLRIIPGVNKFFLEQEAKIKTDKILAAAEEERRRGHIV